MKYALITGATTGIGAQTAKRLTLDGWRVFVTGPEPSAPLRLDVTDVFSIARARAQVLRETNGHGLDLLINNAGVGVLGPMLELAEAEVRRMFDVNVHGALAVTRAFAPEMISRRAGHVVLVGSLAGRATFPFFGPYCASKHAVEAMADALRLELHALGLRVSLIEPGIVGTGFLQGCLQSLQTAAAADSPWATALANMVKLHRRLEAGDLTPEQVAERIAAVTRTPRARARVGLFASVMVRLLGALPTPLADLVLRRMLGLRPTDAAGQAPVAASCLAQRKITQ